MPAKSVVQAKAPNRSAGKHSIEQVVHLLGGPRVLGRRISSKHDVHEAITNGIPGGALVHMVSHVRTLKPDDVSRAVGVSLRTVQRRTKLRGRASARNKAGAHASISNAMYAMQLQEPFALDPHLHPLSP